MSGAIDEGKTKKKYIRVEVFFDPVFFEIIIE